MDELIAYTYRFIMYVFFGLTLEMVFSVLGIDHSLGFKIKGRVPKKYLEGFVSLYMIPLHGFGLLFLFEPVHHFIANWFWVLRFCVWAVLISCMEVLYGVLCHKVFGFYSWDYYKESKYKIFKEGYTLWTLVPQWGIAGLILEQFSDLVIYLSPFVVSWVQ